MLYILFNQELDSLEHQHQEPLNIKYSYETRSSERHISHTILGVSSFVCIAILLLSTALVEKRAFIHPH
jgi:hypothetical protein